MDELDFGQEALDEWEPDDYISRDPGHPLGFETSEAFPLPIKIVTPQTTTSSFPSTSDTFSQLPVELLEIILSLLPVTSVQAIRLASKSFGSLVLAQNYWRSRFIFLHKLCHFSDFASSISLKNGANID